VFAIIFGVAGYVLERTGVRAVYALLAALALALVAGQITVRLVNRWWAKTPDHDVEDERYELQGHLARVTVPIANHGDGEVTFEVGPILRVVRARNIDEGPVASGTEVVIERIEDDVAYVESWEQVEKRIS
jgi:membrane protein implicated in regulation of membrane protease activity